MANTEVVYSGEQMGVNTVNPAGGTLTVGFSSIGNAGVTAYDGGAGEGHMNMIPGATGVAGIRSARLDAANAVGITLNNSVTLSTAGAKIASFQNNGTEKAAIDKDGSLLTNKIIGLTTAGDTITLAAGGNTYTVPFGAGNSHAFNVTSVGTITNFEAVAANPTGLNGQVEVSHLANGSGAPGSAAGAGAGTGPTISVAGSGDIAGKISVTTGTTPAGTNAVIVTLTFAHAYASAPQVILSPGNAAAAALTGATQVFATSTTTTLVLTSGATALAASTAYVWYYMAIQ